MTDIKKQVPNVLTVFRILASLVFAFLILKNKIGSALLLFAFASISDFLDGYLARKWNVVSDLGKILDPIADKTLMFCSYGIFAYDSSISVWVSVIVIGRDVLILSVALICKILKIDLKISPLRSSKINTAIQLLFVIMILLLRYFSLDFPLLINIGSIIVCLSTIVSGADYFKNYYWIKDAVCKATNRR